MLSTEVIVKEAINFIILASSVMINIFIVFVTTQSWVKNKMFKKSDQIICGISASNMFSALYSISLIFFFVLDMNQDPTVKVLQALLSVSMSSSVWFSTGLSVHYCLKIVNWKQRFYISLQKCFGQIFYITLGMVLILISCSNFLRLAEKVSLNMTTGDASDYVSLSQQMSRSSFQISLIYLAVSAVAFILFSSSASIIIISLYRHIKRMEHGANKIRSPNMEVHVRAAKTVSCLLATHVLYLITFVIVLPLVNLKYLRDIFIIVSTCNFLCALILIRANTQLEKTAIDLFHWFSCCGTSENPSAM